MINNYEVHRQGIIKWKEIITVSRVHTAATLVMFKTGRYKIPNRGTPKDIMFTSNSQTQVSGVYNTDGC
jgi:hypothetical protein